MPTPTKGARLGSGPAHQRHMLANLASELFVHGRITTTEAKARALRPYAEKLITKAKRGDLHARRLVMAKIRDRDVVAYLFEDVAPRFVDRNGGYTRILKLNPRKGDNAKMAIIELVDLGEGTGEEQVEESKQGRMRGIFGRRRRRQESASAGLGIDDLDLTELEDDLEGDFDEDGEDADADEPEASGEDADGDEDED